MCLSCLLGLILAGLVFAQPPGSAAVGTTQGDGLAEYLITGWRAARESLNSGEVHIEGKDILYADAKRSSLTYERKIDISLTFDRSRKVVKSTVFWEGRDDGRWLLTPEFLAQCATTPTPVVDLVNPSEPNTLAFVKHFDPRCIAIGGYGGFYNALSFEEAAQMFEDGDHQVRKIDDDRYELEWEKEFGGRIRRTVVTLNESQGFSIERTAVTWKGVDADWEIKTVADTQWEEHDATWVPVSMAADGISNDRVELTLKWESVNAAIPGQEFTIENLGAPVDASIVDRRLSLEDPIIIGRVGRPDYVPPPRTVPATDQPLFRLRTVLLLALNAVVVVLLGVFYYLNRKSGRTKPSE